MSQVWYISYLIILNAALVINPGYMLGIMTRPAVNRQDTLILLYAETGLLNRPGFWTISRQHIYIWIAPSELCAYKSLDYIILNSQHGWIFMVINNRYYWVFKSRFSATVIILSKDMIYSTMEGIVPSHCRLTTRHLGLHYSNWDYMQVSCHCKHAPWHLGANAKSFLLVLLKTRLIIL